MKRDPSIRGYRPQEPLASNQPFRHTSLHNTLEHVTQHITFAKAAVPVLRETRMIRHLVFKAESAEPAIRQVQMHLQVRKGSIGATRSSGRARCRSICKHWRKKVTQRLFNWVTWEHRREGLQEHVSQTRPPA